MPDDGHIFKDTCVNICVCVLCIMYAYVGVFLCVVCACMVCGHRCVCMCSYMFAYVCLYVCVYICVCILGIKGCTLK